MNSKRTLKVVLFAAVFGMSAAIQAAESSGNKEAAHKKNIPSQEAVQERILIEGVSYVIDIDFSDSARVIQAVDALKAEALAKGANANGLIENILTQLIIAAENRAMNTGMRVALVEIGNVKYPVLIKPPVTAGVTGSAFNNQAMSALTSETSEMQTDNQALINQVQQNASPK